MPETKIELLHPSIKIHSIEGYSPVIITAECTRSEHCIHCGGTHLRIKDRIDRKIRHESIGLRNCWLHLRVRKYHCQSCGKYFRPVVPGLLRYKRSTEHFRREIYARHRDGISQQTIHERSKIGSATVERWFHEILGRKEREFSNRHCPAVMGIDEHFFSKKDGYATTFADLKKGKVFELALGRTHSVLHKVLSKMRGRDRVRVICIDLSATYRKIIRLYFPNALIVSDRFHVVRLVNQHFLAAWKQLDPIGRKNRGLLSLMRRSASKLKPEQQLKLDEYFRAFPAVQIIYQAKEELHGLLTRKRLNKNQCRPLARRLLDWIAQLKSSPMESMQTLGHSLDNWRDEIARMWRFTKNNAVTEGLHTKMEMISRRAFGFKNFNNYRLRVIVLCG